MIKLFDTSHQSLLDKAFEDNLKVKQKAIEELQINGVKLVRELKEILDKPK